MALDSEVLIRNNLIELVSVIAERINLYKHMLSGPLLSFIISPIAECRKNSYNNHTLMDFHKTKEGLTVPKNRIYFLLPIRKANG